MPFVQWTLVFVGAALSGSVLVFSLWPPLSSSQKGLAIALLSVIVALHLLLAAGLQLYFFRYGSSPATLSRGVVDPGHLMHVKLPPVDKVTELQPSNLILEDHLFDVKANKTATTISNSVGVTSPPTASKIEVPPNAHKVILKEKSNSSTTISAVTKHFLNVTKLT